MTDSTTPSVPPGAFRPRESVWDYPRPPDIKASERHVRVVVDGVTVAESTRAIRVLEQGHPPVWYLPPADVRTELLETTSRQSACEFKGEASYFGIRGREPVRSSRDRNRDVAWTYLDPLPDYDAIRDYIAFYSDRVDEAWIDDERVEPQAGDFYGGWITAEIDGPFKGPPGTLDW